MYPSRNANSILGTIHGVVETFLTWERVLGLDAWTTSFLVRVHLCGKPDKETSLCENAHVVILLIAGGRTELK